MVDGAGGRGGRCVHGADGRTGGWLLMRRSGGRGGKAADGWADGGGKGADSRADGRTGPTRRGHVDGRKRHGQGLGGADRAQHARTGGQAVGQCPVVNTYTM